MCYRRIEDEIDDLQNTVDENEENEYNGQSSEGDGYEDEENLSELEEELRQNNKMKLTILKAVLSGNFLIPAFFMHKKNTPNSWMYFRR